MEELRLKFKINEPEEEFEQHVKKSNKKIAVVFWGQIDNFTDLNK